MSYQTGFFSGPVGTPLNQSFFDAAFASHLNANKIYKQAYHCNIIQTSGMMQWLDEFVGHETDCYDAYSLIETYGYRNLVKVQSNVNVDNYPNLTVIELDPGAAYTSNAYLLPQVGNSLVLPNGQLLKVTALGTASALDPKITVMHRSTTGADYALQAGDELLVLSGSEIADCACPTGQFAVPDAPIVTDLAMFTFGDKGEVCGKALHKCQWLKIPLYDECGNEVQGLWYTEALQQMYQRFEKRKFYETLMNPNFGIIPIIKARGMKWTENTPGTIVEEDFRTWKIELDKAGIGCREFAFFAGRNKFSQFQRAFKALGIATLQYSERPLNDCTWIDLQYCGIRVEGLTIHVYEEPMFSNGKELGTQNSVFPDSVIIIPMCNRPGCNRSTGRTDAGGKDMKMLSRVYFRNKSDGRVWDTLTDSNGVFGPRNTFGTGCEQHEWTIKTQFLNEVHCANWWGYMGL
jgi:hypothetical protein